MNPDNATYLGSYIVASGTTILDSQTGRLKRVILAGSFVGSVEFYDTNAVAGTAAGNLLYNVAIPITNAYKNIELELPYKKGLVSVATGTPILGVVWVK